MFYSMIFLLQLNAAVSLPHYMRPGLHDIAIEDNYTAVNAAAQSPLFGVADLCSQVYAVKKGRMCEAVSSNDLADAEVRLSLRRSSVGDGSGVAYVDGDTFFPQDGRAPRIIEPSNTKVQPARSHSGLYLTTHKHVCPVVGSPSFSASYTEDDMLCVDVAENIQRIGSLEASFLSFFHVLKCTLVVQAAATFIAAISAFYY